jgi:hypothetical protein
LELEADGAVVCKFCGTPNALSGTLCPRCEWVNPTRADVCETCSASLYRTCPACRTRNWSGASHCVKCAEPLDALSLTAARLQLGDTASRLSQQQRMSRDLKQDEDRAAQARSAKFADVETERRRVLAEAHTRQQVREQQMTLGLLVGIGVVVFIVVAVLVYTLVIPR